MDELRKSGTFEAGVYRRNEGEPGKRNMDGFQAIWEHVNGRPLQFPKPRYAQPIMMDQAHYDWVALPDLPACPRSCSACSPSGARRPSLLPARRPARR